jgi:lipooligosaccharide transport system permease protein
MRTLRIIANISPRGVYKMWQRDLKAFRKLFWISMVPTLFGPLILMVTLGAGVGVLVKSVQGLTYQQFIAPGLLATTAMLGATYECTYNSYVRLTFQKTYDAILATPLNIGEIVTGELLWGATRGLLGGAAFLLIIWLFGLVQSPWAVLTLPLLFAAGLMFAAISMSFTGVATDMSLFTYFFTMFVTPLFLVSGIFFPIQNLPGWAQWLIGLTPLIHTVTATRGLLSGQISSELLIDVLYILAVTLVFFVLSIGLMHRKVIQ